jgi:arginine-tRNA-protein transferase
MNRDLRVSRRSPEYAGEHYALYERYLKSRHAGGGMDNPTPEQYMEFLTSQWSETAFYEFRDRQRLLAVAITDRLVNGLSAVYTFFEPDEPRRSLGVFSVLWQIEEARRIGADWLYLGYLIEESPKMSYKRQYQPQEWFLGDQWVRDRSR